MTLHEAAQALGATLCLAPGVHGEHAFVGVSTDSRTAAPGMLFVALRGARYDGHAFVAEVARAGVLAVVVDAQAEPDTVSMVTCLVVADTERALGQLAQWVRRARHAPVVAITGSNGKTSTKEMTAQALGARGVVHRTAGNLNNLIGVPRTLFDWPQNAWCAVVEMGMNAPGEIARLTEMAAPEVGLVTCVAAAHLEGLGTLERVAAAKAELFSAMPDKATAVLNGDDAPLWAAAAPLLKGRPRVVFGRAATADVRLCQATHVRDRGQLGLRVELAVQGQHHETVLPVVGVHNGMNAAAAVACAQILGVTPDQAMAQLAEVHIPGARGRVVPLPPSGALVLDDCYNANPHSMAAALATLQDLARGHASFAVLGDMLELGAEAPAHHRALGRAAAQAGLTHLFAVGAMAHETAQGAKAAGLATTVLDHVTQAVPALKPLLGPGDWCLVKGSRGMRLERVVEGLVALGTP